MDTARQSKLGIGTTGLCKTTMDNRIQISINDSVLETSVNPEHGWVQSPEPIRAHSLNRLDAMLQEDSEMEAYYIFKCPSFPGLTGDIAVSARTLSTTYLETDSISPRVSTTTISQDLEAERLGLALMGIGISPLSRSTSARTIDLPAACTSLAKLITPSMNNVTGENNRKIGKQNKVSRSLSCPSINHSIRPIFVPHGFVAYRPRGSIDPRSRGPEDPDLTNENIDDLPVAPNKNYPDFVPDLIEERICSFTKRNLGFLDATSTSLYCGTYLSAPGFSRTATSSPLLKNNGEYHLLSPDRPLFGHQRAPQLVEIKCLQWLNSLDSER